MGTNLNKVLVLIDTVIMELKIDTVIMELKIDTVIMELKKTPVIMEQAINNIWGGGEIYNLLKLIQESLKLLKETLKI